MVAGNEKSILRFGAMIFWIFGSLDLGTRNQLDGLPSQLPTLWLCAGGRHRCPSRKGLCPYLPDSGSAETDVLFYHSTEHMCPPFTPPEYLTVLREAVHCRVSEF